ncbi:MAG: AAA family ATPase [Polyangiaceae bacterium]|nr:AAA family ATPase [Polyangiaceae bacterium]
MPYVALGRIASALKSLQRFHAFYGITFLSMKKADLKVGRPIAWGSQQENEILATFYSPPGAPPDKPYFVPFGRADAQSGSWKNPKYSGGTLQRARTTDNFKDALQHPTRDTWAFTANYVSVLANLLPKEGDKVTRLPVFDVIAWLYRDRDLPNDLKKVEEQFRNEFNIDDKEFKQLFESTTEDASQFFFTDPVDRDEFIQLIDGVPEGPTLAGRGEEDLIKAIETFITEKKLLALPGGFVRSFYYSIKTQRFVVLAGRPGTGKTAFARAFAAALNELFANAVSETIVSIGPDFSESDVLGYEKIAGDLAATELTRRLFLSGRPKDIYVVILDEMNLAQVDHYLARLLPAVESDAPVELPGQDGTRDLPPDTFIVGTINSFVEESTRLPLSGPVKRRANIMEMPNLLGSIVADNDRSRFETILGDLLKQTRERYRQRQKSGQASVLDAYRIANLDAALQKNSHVRAASFVDALWRICQICANAPETSLTFGVVQDVVDFAALAGTDALAALDLQIAQKIVPQLAGPASVAKELLGLVQSLKSPEHPFTGAATALSQLIASEDPSSGTVYFRY